MGSVPEEGPISRFPADDLRPITRYITSHNKQGKGVFVKEDDGNHHRVMVRGQGVANILYSTDSNPVDLNGDKDIDWAQKNEVSCLPHRCFFSRTPPKLLENVPRVNVGSLSFSLSSRASTSPTAPSSV